MRFPLIFLMGLSFACTGDSSVVVQNRDPEATITSHSDGAVILAGRSVTFTGTVNDDDDLTTELVASFQINGEPLCPAATPEDNGTISCESTLEAGEFELALVVQDPDDATGRAVIDLVVQATDAPTVEIIEPDPATGRFYAETPIAWSAVIDDKEDPNENLILTWSSDLRVIS